MEATEIRLSPRDRVYLQAMVRLTDLQYDVSCYLDQFRVRRRWNTRFRAYTRDYEYNECDVRQFQKIVTRYFETERVICKYIPVLWSTKYSSVVDMMSDFKKDPHAVCEHLSHRIAFINSIAAMLIGCVNNVF